MQYLCQSLQVVVVVTVVYEVYESGLLRCLLLLLL